jgi:aspartyl-tRNA(Asn)/glutamyl-tRNA(Gln) amidotransferase subunit C
MTIGAALSAEEVERLATLARLRLTPEEIESFRQQLSAVLEHVQRLATLDISGVEPMAHPLEIVNRMDEDEVAEPMPVEALLALAPAVEDRFLAVPKVVGAGGTEA